MKLIKPDEPTWPTNQEFRTKICTIVNIVTNVPKFVNFRPNFDLKNPFFPDFELEILSPTLLSLPELSSRACVAPGSGATVTTLSLCTLTLPSERECLQLTSLPLMFPEEVLNRLARMDPLSISLSLPHIRRERKQASQHPRRRGCSLETISLSHSLCPNVKIT